VVLASDPEGGLLPRRSVAGLSCARRWPRDRSPVGGGQIAALRARIDSTGVDTPCRIHFRSKARHTHPRLTPARSTSPQGVQRWPRRADSQIPRRNRGVTSDVEASLTRRRGRNRWRPSRGGRTVQDSLRPSPGVISVTTRSSARLTQKRSLARTQHFAFKRCSNLAEPLFSPQTPVWKLIA
jgi:hypothetical protein